jgi:hypothetical protein
LDGVDAFEGGPVCGAGVFWAWLRPWPGEGVGAAVRAAQYASIPAALPAASASRACTVLSGAVPSPFALA